MKYMLMIYGDEAQEANLTEADWAELLKSYEAYSAVLAEAGVMLGGDGLQPTSTATTVRVRDGATDTTDGPFAESKEQLGGFYMIDVPDLDTALKYAAQCPGAKDGAVEVRPVMLYE